MKKALKYISGFISTFLIVVCLILSDVGIVNAAPSDANKEQFDGEGVTGNVSYKNPITTTVKYGASYQKVENVSENNFVSVNSKGKITIRYTYGFSEVIVLAQSCIEYYDSDYKKIDRLGDGESPAYCGKFSKNVELIHVSGTMRKTKEGYEEKTFSLFKYFSYDAIVKVRLIYEFDTTGTNESFYGFRYCNTYIEYDEETEDNKCNKENQLANKVSLTARLGVLKEEISAKGESVTGTASYDKLGLVYSGTKQLSLSNAVGGDNIIIKVDNTSFSDSKKQVDDMIYDTVIPALITILTIIAGVMCVVMGYKIVKSSDDPQERSESVRTLRNILIGVAIAYILLFVTEPAARFIERFL